MSTVLVRIPSDECVFVPVAGEKYFVECCPRPQRLFVCNRNLWRWILQAVTKLKQAHATMSLHPVLFSWHHDLEGIDDCVKRTCFEDCFLSLNDAKIVTSQPGRGLEEVLNQTWWNVIVLGFAFLCWKMILPLFGPKEETDWKSSCYYRFRGIERDITLFPISFWKRGLQLIHAEIRDNKIKSNVWYDSYYQEYEHFLPRRRKKTKTRAKTETRAATQPSEFLHLHSF